MKLYPAIDIKDSKCVRLIQGRADQQTVYYDDPAEPAQLWLAAGSEWIHVVDLDGAFEGKPMNLDAVSRIAQTGMKVELGGGMRTEQDIRSAIAAGVDRVIIGTRACADPYFLKGVVAEFEEKIAVGIDAKNGKVAVKGWVDVSDVNAMDLASQVAEMGVQTLIYTDISRDGMLTGPNFEAQEQLCRHVPGINIIASGGVSRIEDIERFASMAKDLPNLNGVIIGKALYEKKFDLKDALALC